MKKFLLSFLIFAVFFFGAGSIAFAVQAAEAQSKIITTRADLFLAINNAASGGTILVGDINFNDDPKELNEQRRIKVDKSVTIKSGKTNGSRAKFTGGSFIIDGPLAGGKITCVLEDIIFDGLIDGKLLTKSDWEPSGNHHSEDPEKAQYAALFKGNVDASFNNCEFTQYAYTFGGAVWCNYNDEIYGEPDYRFCNLNLSLTNCAFTKNSSYNGGGAIYLRGNGDNVSFSAVNCDFTENISSIAASGGGAIFIHGVKASFQNCLIAGNIGNYVYDGEETFLDYTGGGGILCFTTSLNMLNCIIADNIASIGGGIALHHSKANIDGCVITKNKASTDAEYFDSLKDDAYGMLNCQMGIGGGIFINTQDFFGQAGPNPVTVLNTSIYQNTALNAYGGICIDYEEEQGYRNVTLIFCTYAQNLGGYVYSFEPDGFGEEPVVPRDMWALHNVSAFGCVIESEYYIKTELPKNENDYNYFVSLAEGIFAENQTDNYMQLYLKNRNFVVPYDAIKELLNGRFENSFGDYYVGTNYKTCVKVRLNATGSTLNGTELSFEYGQIINLPVPKKDGYSFIEWHYNDGKQVKLNGLSFGGNIEFVDVYAKWESDDIPFPAWAIALIVLGSLALLGGAGLGGRQYRKKQKLAINSAGAGTLETGEQQSTIIVPTGTENIDKLAEKYGLTAREKEIVSLLVKGKTQGNIAKELFVSIPTVKKHTQNIYSKIAINSRFELIAKLTQSEEKTE